MLCTLRTNTCRRRNSLSGRRVPPTLPTRTACLSGARPPSSATPRKTRTRRSAARADLVGGTDRSPSPSTRPSFRRRWAAVRRTRTRTRKRKKACSSRRSRARARTADNPVRPASTLDSRLLGPSSPGGASRDLRDLRRRAGRPRLPPESTRQLRPYVLLPLRHRDPDGQRRRTAM